MATISLCMIVRNEEANLPRSLAPVARFFDEVVVVDTGSMDGTIPLARKYGAKVAEVPWRNDFAYARNQSIARASGDWILWLDADNRLTEADAGKIKNLIDARCDRILWCTEVVEPRGDRLVQKRIFPNRPGFRFAGIVHEQLVHPAGIRYCSTDIRIYHWGYADKALLREKGLRNRRLLEQTLGQDPDDFYAAFNLARCCANFREDEAALLHLQRVRQSPMAPKENPEIYGYAFVFSSVLLERLGRPQEACRVLNNLLDEMPKYGLGWFHEGKQRLRRGDWAGAVEALKRFEELGIAGQTIDLPREKIHFESCYWLAQGYERLGRAGLARDSYERALLLEPSNGHVRRKLSNLAGETAGM